MAQSSGVEPRRSGRSSHPSKRLRRAEGLPSSSEDESDSSSDSEIEVVPPPPASSAISSSTSSASASASAPAATSSSASTRTTQDKQEKFDRRYETATKTNEEVLELQMKSWTSKVYQHFTSPPTISVVRGEVKYVFYCKSHPLTSVTRARYDDSTSNLGRHVVSCAPVDNQESRAMISYAKHGSTYTEAKHRVKIALWIARRRRAFVTVEDAELLDIFHDLNASCITPSRNTVSRDIKEIHAITKEAVIELLSRITGKLHISADGWTTPNVIAFIGIIVHYVLNGKIESLLLDFVKATKAHTGAYLATRVAQCLQDFKLEKKVLAITCDSAKNNDTMVTELQALVPSFRGRKMQVRCFAHVLNLVAKAMLSPFATKAKKNDDEDITDGDAEDLEDLLQTLQNDSTVVDDHDPLLSAATNGEDNEDVAEDVAHSDNTQVLAITEEADLDGRLDPLPRRVRAESALSITKIRQLAIKSSNSPTIIEVLYELCDQLNLDRKKMIGDVPTRWNSTSETTRRALELRPALDRLVLLPEFNKPRGVRLKRFQLLSTEWALLKELSPLLDTLTYTTKKVSTGNVPLIAQVIPFIDSITNHFDSVIDNVTASLAVRHAALRGLLILNKYYARTDEAVVYRIAMMLNPRMKTQYFVKAKWEESWISDAKKVIREEWETHYKPSQPSTPVPQPSDEDASQGRFAHVSQYFHDEVTAEPIGDALDEWLAEPLVMTAADPITFWTGMLAASHPLAQMALDFLSIPATSTDVERAFSRGGLTVSKLRHSLSDKSVRCSTVLGAWCEKGNLVPVDEIVEVFKDKKSRTKKRKADSDIIVIDS